MTRFVKGQSGNPGGRPKEVAEVKELARQQTKAAIERLIHWMRSDNPRASVSAATTLLERGWGKPESKVDVAVTQPTVMRMPAVTATAEEWIAEHGPRAPGKNLQ